MLPHYYSLNEYLLNTFGSKMYKLALNARMTCPNRDGLIDTRGCIFCSAGGSGDFAGNASTVTEQIEAGISQVSGKYHGDDYIAYFQAYTNTYAPVEYLRNVYMEAALNSHIRIISIATRPDCLDDGICRLLADINSIKPVWIELGLQTTNCNSVRYIRRGYKNECFADAIMRLRHFHSCEHIIAHMIIGLPGETTADMLATASYISRYADGIKLQLLHILKGTDLADDYAAQHFHLPELDEYIDILEEIIKRLPPDMVVHRLTGDGPKKLLIAPMWSADKKHVLNTINQRFMNDCLIQGSLYRK